MRPALSKSASLALGFLGFFAFLIFLNLAQSLLIPLTFGLLAALVMYPVVRRLEKWRFSPTMAILMAMLGVGLLLLLLTGLITTQFLGFSKEFPLLAEKLTVLTETFFAQLQSWTGMSEQGAHQMVEDSLKSWLQNSEALISTALSTTTTLLTWMILVPMYAFFFLLYRRQFRNFLYQISPKSMHDEVEEALPKVQRVIRSYVEGLLVVTTIVAVMNVLGLWALGIRYAVFFGVFAALLTVIPYIGIMIGAIPPLLIALTMDSMWYAAGVVGIFGMVQFLAGNLITPYIMGNKVSVNPLAAMVALIAGGMIWGTWGLILFVPLVAMFKVFCDAVEGLQPIGALLGTMEKTVKKSPTEVLYQLGEDALNQIPFMRRRNDSEKP